jgi:HK97 gp10 family phage protein
MSAYLGENIKCEGLKEFYEGLKTLPFKMRAAIFKRVNRKLINIPKKALIGAIRERGYGKSDRKFGIKESEVIIQNDKYNHSGVIVGLSQDAFMARFIEEGTVGRYNYKRNGKKLSKQAFRGEIKANPFIVPAYEDANNDIQNMLENEYEKLIYTSIQSSNRTVKRKLKSL